MNDNQPLSVRDALPAEIEAVLTLTLTSYTQYAPLMPHGHWDAYRSNIIDTIAAIKPGECIVAERAGTLAGSVLLYPPHTASDPDHADAPALPEIRLLAVPPEARGQGVAKALMAECLQRARLMGAAAIGLHTTDMMTVAMGMYERMGFVRDPARDFSPGEGVIIKGYRLDLAAASRES